MLSLFWQHLHRPWPKIASRLSSSSSSSSSRRLSKPQLAELLLLSGHVDSLEDANAEVRWLNEYARRSGSGGKDERRNEKGVEEKTLLLLRQLVERRVQGEPLQYILGTTPFGPLLLKTRKPVLIPRPETEYWVSRLAEELSLKSRPGGRRRWEGDSYLILDVGTGTGCISLLLTSLLLLPLKSVHCVAVDTSLEALKLARENAEALRLGDNITFAQMDLYDRNFHSRVLQISQREKFDLVVSNPPYIPESDYGDLDQSVRAWENREALVGRDADGMGAYRALAELCFGPQPILQLDGTVAVELGHDQSERVKAIFAALGPQAEYETWEDQYGVPRTLIGRKETAGDVRK